MKILIDIGHPAHVHYYRNFIQIMQNKGHTFSVIARDRSCIFELLDYYNIKYKSRGKGKSSILGKVVYSLWAYFVLFSVALKFKPDLFMSAGGIYTGPISWLFGKPNITTEDTENAIWSHRISKPFTNYYLTPDCFEKNLGKNQIKFKGYMELCYLHPNYFKPDLSILKYLGINDDENYVILRFVSWNAHHDRGHRGLDIDTKRRAVQELSKYARVFISTESDLPNDLRKYQINIPSYKMHDALFFASLIYGESATMASECACLGVPAIYHNDQGPGYPRQQEREYGLVLNYSESISDQGIAIDMATNILKDKNSRSKFRSKSIKMLAEKIDVTAFWVWFIDNYPQSVEMVRDEEEFWEQFK